MAKKIVGKYIYLVFFVLLTVVIIFPAQLVHAYDETIVIEAEEKYETETEFTVNFIVYAAERISMYHVEITYDTEALNYVYGADNESNGTLVFAGSDQADTVIYPVTFFSQGRGETTFTVKYALINGVYLDQDSFLASNNNTVGFFIGSDDEYENYLNPTTEETSETESAQFETDAEIVENAETDIAADENSKLRISIWIVIIIAAVAACIAWLIIAKIIRTKRKNKRKKEKTAARRTPKPIDDIIEILNLDEYEKPDLIVDPNKGKEPVISIRNVGIKFKTANSDASGIKEYAIQKIKRKIKRRYFTALQNISFDVYRGDVVGIIGTNGSGKSTLLKIVSGALKPTEGEIHVDFNKVQLLTIGTGFDRELTGRENVYLNGAIIGYSKKFIDEHYKDIVEFAELQDFMEEKVKNYSSGMVSRLGFAIATAGNAAEILILDEVLSVGDEFFRKKSLARVKEMIHGGSTVLLVSHNMSTICDNCNRAVWIEKSRMKMIGDAEIVARSYQNYNS